MFRVFVTILAGVVAFVAVLTVVHDLFVAGMTKETTVASWTGKPNDSWYKNCEDDKKFSGTCTGSGNGWPTSGSNLVYTQRKEGVAITLASSFPTLLVLLGLAGVYHSGSLASRYSFGGLLGTIGVFVVASVAVLMLDVVDPFQEKLVAAYATSSHWMAFDVMAQYISLAYIGMVALICVQGVASRFRI